ncbi:MAG TPA: type IV toxin-antitoxin system AbiEi family antitoxin domain-containing protein [Verrucomicrobiae bacterium]|nr:type IV toxin-antitoxin system AbiEi family antitoxin domain-containing protein [Verrucomicrobiae bacterium]
MHKKLTDTERVLALARQAKVVRVKDLAEQGLHPELLRRLYQKGLLARSSRGVYRLANAEFSEDLSLATVAKRVPQAVFCLLTALRFHEIGTQNPSELWLALDRRAARPRIDSPRLRVMRFSGDALTEGIETHDIEHVRVRLYNPAKTVADCFKYRNKIGLDVALEALRECWRSRKATADELWRYAKICRVANVMRPYLESLT